MITKDAATPTDFDIDAEFFKGIDIDWARLVKRLQPDASGCRRRRCLCDQAIFTPLPLLVQCPAHGLGGCTVAVPLDGQWPSNTSCCWPWRGPLNRCVIRRA
jgi:hypothetical protein